jgi:GTPase SAR1 family protein
MTQPVLQQVLQQVPREYKIVVDGAPGVGKTTLVSRVRLGRCKGSQIGYTPGGTVYPLRIQTNRGPLTCTLWDLWDLKGEESHHEVHYHDAHGLVSVYDLTAPATQTRACAIVDEHTELPAVLCGTKYDLTTVFTEFKVPRTLLGTQYYPVSARTSTAELCEKPFLDLLRRITGDDRLQFVGMPSQALQDTDPVNLGAVRHFEYTARSGSYAALGEPVRGDLEPLVVEAGRQGYMTVVKLTVSHRRA